MAAPRQIDLALTELRRLARIARRRPTRIGDAAPLIARIVGGSRTAAIEERAGGIAFRLDVPDARTPCSLTCVLHEAGSVPTLSAGEREVAMLLCDGRTLAQIAHLRGVTINTVKSQVRQVFRKLDVDTRVALVRRLLV